MSEMVKSAQPTTVPSYAPPLSVPNYTNLTSHHKGSPPDPDPPSKPIAKHPVNEAPVRKPEQEPAARPAPEPSYKPPPDKPPGQVAVNSVLPVSPPAAPTVESRPKPGDGDGQQTGKPSKNNPGVSSVTSNNEQTAKPSPSSGPMSITNKIKNLQSRQASSKQSSTLSKDDRSELQGLWKMQAQLHQQKPAVVPKSKPTTSTISNSSAAPTVTTNALSQSVTNATTSVTAPVSSNAALSSSSSKPLYSPSVSSSKPQPSTAAGSSAPTLLHTPRSPPHPPPSRPPPSYSQQQSHHYNPSHNSPYYPPQPSTYQPPSYVPPPSSVPSLASAGQPETRRPVNDATNERMEVKNSGIPGPSAISWKRKSAEDSPSEGAVNKKRKVATGSEQTDDPYSFDEEDKSKSSRKEDSKKVNGTVSNSGGYKYKSALLSRDHDVEDSDESSMSGGASPSKKSKKRPKLEEWSVNKEKNTKKTPKKEDTSNSKQESKVNSNKKISPSKAEKNGKMKHKELSSKSNEKEAKPSVANVWLQAFGAGLNKSKKKDSEIEKESSKAKIKSEKTEVEPPVVSSTILDIPPEVRRRPRPKFGGLIHFDPDWNRGVRRHHERCRLPSKLENSSELKPKILAGHQTPKKNFEDQARKAMVSPPNMLAIEKERLEKNAAAHKLPVSVMPEEELSGELPSIVETILENRKKLREASEGRMYKIPFMKEKKKRMMRAPVQSEIKTGPLGLLPTPGLPLLTDDTKDVLLGTGFGNFRHYTLSKFIQNEFKMSDIRETKPRRQTSSSKPAVNIREIFGVETPSKKSKKKATEESAKKVSVKEEPFREPSTPQSTPVKKERKKKSKSESRKSSPSPSPSVKSRKFVAKFQTAETVKDEPEDECGYSHETGDPTDKEKNLQFDLGAFALDLLEDNPSWSKQVAIQNLVIWEPTEPVIQETAKKKKGKKKRTRKSGMDFQTNKRKSRGAAASRAGSPEAEDVHEVVYNLDNVIGESNRWVIDKNAGETILHRASKMGYPDVAAYALDMANLGPMDRDYAGLTPLHKAALKGHPNVARILLSYGADPGAGVKGTRALHEGTLNFKSYNRGKCEMKFFSAIEGGDPATARVLLSYGADPLLHDYSGNMPLDLATDRNMQLYFTNLLTDLHGKVPTRAKNESTFSTTKLTRWNISHCPEFFTPPPNLPSLTHDAKVKRKKCDLISFECSTHLLPPFYQLKDKEGDWVLYRDLKDYTKKYCHGKEDIRKKGNLLEMKQSDFLRNSHCKELDRSKVEVRFHDREQENIVVLVKVDKYTRKILNTDTIEVPS